MDAHTILDREFLEIRAKILQVGAELDRIDRADGTASDDPRLAQIARAIDVLASSDSDRAEQIQMIFSLPYDSGWRETFGLRRGDRPAAVDTLRGDDD